MNAYLRQIASIVWKDITLEQRTRQSISAMLVFAMAAIVTFSFALDAQLDAARSVALGLLWTTVWLAGTLGINRTFSAETESRALDALLVAPVERSAIFLGKAASLFISLMITELILVPLFAVFFNRPLYHPMIILILLLGTLGYVLAGVFVGTIAVQTRTSYLLVPILILPLTLPIVLTAASASAQFLSPTPDWTAVSVPLLLVVIYDILMLLCGLIAYNYVLEE